MKINVNGELKELECRVWDQSRTGYGEDAAPDMLDAVRFERDPEGNVLMTEEDYEAAVDYLKECAEEDNSARDEDDPNKTVVFFD